MYKNIIKDIKKEIKRQNKKWGKNRVLPPHVWLTVLVEEVGEIARAILEVPATDDYTNYREELVQAAAVCIAAIESHDREQITPTNAILVSKGEVIDPGGAETIAEAIDIIEAARQTNCAEPKYGDR